VQGARHVFFAAHFGAHLETPDKNRYDTMVADEWEWGVMRRRLWWGVR
jgi:hypothetical protein